MISKIYILHHLGFLARVYLDLGAVEPLPMLNIPGVEALNVGGAVVVPKLMDGVAGSAEKLNPAAEYWVHEIKNGILSKGTFERWSIERNIGDYFTRRRGRRRSELERCGIDGSIIASVACRAVLVVVVGAVTVVGAVVIVVVVVGVATAAAAGGGATTKRERARLLLRWGLLARPESEYAGIVVLVARTAVTESGTGGHVRRSKHRSLRSERRLFVAVAEYTCRSVGCAECGVRGLPGKRAARRRCGSGKRSSGRAARAARAALLTERGGTGVLGSEYRSPDAEGLRDGTLTSRFCLGLRSKGGRRRVSDAKSRGGSVGNGTARRSKCGISRAGRNFPRTKSGRWIRLRRKQRRAAAVITEHA